MFKKLQNITAAFQLFQVFRYGFLLLASIGLTRLFVDDTLVIKQYEMLLLLSGSLTFFWVSGLYDGFLLIYKREGEAGRQAVIFHTFILSLGIGLLAAASIWFGGKYYFGDKIPLAALGWFSIFVFLDVTSYLAVYYLLARGKAGFLVIWGFLAYFFYFLILTLSLYWGYSLEDAIFFLVFLGLAKFLLQAILMKDHLFRFKWSPNLFKQQLRISLPIALALLLSRSAEYVDGFLVENYFYADFEVFRYGAKELPLALLFASSLSVVKSGDISKAIGEGNLGQELNSLKQGGLRLMFLLFPVTLLLLVFSIPLYDWAFGVAFQQSYLIFDLYLLLLIPRLLFPQTILRGFHKTHVMMYSAGIELVLNVALSLWFMHIWGMPGIALATCMAYFADKLFLGFWVKWKLEIESAAYTHFLWWGVCSSALIVAYLLKYSL